jgi:hypothetical protein
VINGKAQVFLSPLTDRAATFLLNEETVVFDDRHVVSSHQGLCPAGLPLLGAATRSALVARTHASQMAFGHLTPGAMPASDALHDRMVKFGEMAVVVLVDPSLGSSALRCRSNASSLAVAGPGEVGSDVLVSTGRALGGRSGMTRSGLAKWTVPQG